jgi:hypothetical protein
MTTDTELLQQALEALEKSLSKLSDYAYKNECNTGVYGIIPAIEAIKARLAQPEQEQFEIEWPEYYDMGMGCGLEDRNITDRYDAMRYGWDEAIEAVAQSLPEKLYIYPQPERKPLSKSVIKRLWHQTDKEPENFARAIEKVHGITE